MQLLSNQSLPMPTLLGTLFTVMNCNSSLLDSLCSSLSLIQILNTSIGTGQADAV